MLHAKYLIVSLAVMMSCGQIAMAQDESDITPLMRAVRNGQSSEVKKLLKQGVDLEAKDATGWTALFYAVALRDGRTVKSLLDKGANMNASSNEGQTPFMVAAENQDDKIAKLLIARGADINATDKNGNSALTLAARGGRNKTYNLIYKAGGIDPREGQTSKPDIAEDKSITRPVPLNRPRPDYTEAARANKVAGIVRVRVLVGVDGQVKAVRVFRGLSNGLTEQAVRAVRRMRFKPAMKDGNPVEFWASVEIEFNLR